MKRLCTVALVLLALLLAGCSPAEMLTPTVATFTTEPSWEPEENQPEAEWISQEQAMLAGWLVTERGDVRHNQQKWQDFLEKCDRGEAASIRTIRYWDDGTQSLYDVSYDGREYTVTVRIHGETATLICTDYLWESGELGPEEEPYDRFLRCSLTGTETIILYEDLIAEPDYSGITAINLHLKEGEPPLLSCEGENCNRILELLIGAEYMMCPPEEYLLGVKLIFPRGEGEELVLEMDLTRGFFRFGEQYYRYGDTSEALLSALGLPDWPAEVKAEYGQP